MADSEEAKLKAEIDDIVKNINETIRKIEQVVPFKAEAAEAADPSAADEPISEPTQPLDKP